MWKKEKVETLELYNNVFYTKWEDGVTPVLFEAMNKMYSMALWGLVVWNLRKLFTNIQDQYKRYEETRVELVQKHGETDDTGGFKVTDKNYEKFMEEFNKLLNIKEDYDFEKPKVNIETLTLSLQDMDALSNIIEFIE